MGHGRSGGERVYIEDFSVYVRDVISHVQDLKAAHAGLPFFLMGHSMVWFVIMNGRTVIWLLNINLTNFFVPLLVWGKSHFLSLYKNIYETCIWIYLFLPSFYCSFIYALI